jgi:hypothetical protein
MEFFSREPFVAGPELVGRTMRRTERAEYGREWVREQPATVLWLSKTIKEHPQPIAGMEIIGRNLPPAE